MLGTIQRNVFLAAKPKMTLTKKLSIAMTVFVIAVAILITTAIRDERVVDFVRIALLDKWNAKMVEYGMARAPVEIDISNAVFVDAVVDWAMQRGRGMANVSRPLVEKYVIIAFAESVNHGVDPLLTLAVMAVESQFNYMAVSHAGAMGLMQIIPRWHRDKIAVAEVFDPAINIRAGVQILNEYIDRERGNVNRGLLRYNGALHIPGATYDSKVLSAHRELQRSVERRFVDNFKRQYPDVVLTASAEE